MVHFLAMTGARFAALRDQLGWSRLHLSRRLACDEKTIRRWEAGELAVPDAVADWLASVARAVDRLPAPDGSWKIH